MNWLSYLLQVNLYLILFYGFYRLLLKTETFFNLNRGYLVASAALAFFIPLMQSEWVRSWFVTEQVSQTFSTFYSPEVFYIPTQKMPKGSLTVGDMLAFSYIIGIILGICRFAGNLAYLGKMMKRKIDGDKNQRAFSFFNVVFVSRELKNRSTIMKHEFVHIRQLHSADIMLFELIAIFNWFNPIVYLYKSSIKQIHEFIADEVASRHEASKADYAMLLFQEQFGVQAIPLTNNFFNNSLLKLRIDMLQKQRSTSTALLKYGLTAPLFMAMIVVSSATLASKSIANIEDSISEVSKQGIEKINIASQPSKSAKQVLAESGIDVSDALIISPTLAKELREAKGLVKKDTPEVFIAAENIVVEKNPEFPGGMEAFAQYLHANLKYPEAAQKANVSGKVYVQFIVNQDGSTSDHEILKGVGYGLDEEAIRVLKSVPKWEAGEHQGRKVNSRFTVPINFVLNNNKKNDNPGIYINKDNGQKIIEGKISEITVTLDNVQGGLKNKPQPLYILDGTEIPSFKLEKIDPNTIEKIDVYKDEKAIVRYGEKAKNGVIVITSKKK
ncbi:M56 family metallopeptidase [Arcicella aquatica]|uniref:M56 family metallopeptidase n=1 Tax=Arcicella aquatica TaxID=217141 RepID=A0ABU5QH12_9BACT|nr:M56 family metallopeptidase [Arcicella aquatica]MEA5256335.1 M56 family metallopeptidase [Arcicella aquatica]